jgi:hypothetical protein
MNPEEHEHAAEQWVDEALTNYRVAVPRPGLETRVLAGLQARAERQQRRWTFALTACAAVVLLAGLLASWPRSKPDAPANIATQAPPAETNAITPVKTVTTQLQNANIQPVHERRTTARKNSVRTPLLVADVKQERFPVSRPLSEQEQLLRIYLRQTPRQELVLIAQQQQSALHIEDLSIPPIEIKDLTPKETKKKRPETREEIL